MASLFRVGNPACGVPASSRIFLSFAAFASWAFYGSGASVELADINQRTEISLRFSALAGAFMVGVAGSRWITGEADKHLLRESVKVAAHKALPARQPEELAEGSPRQVLQEIKQACEAA